MILTTRFRMAVVIVGSALVLAGIWPGGAIAAWESVKLPAGNLAHAIDPGAITQEGGAETGALKIDLALVLDASGSMNAELRGTGSSKLAVAKQALRELIPRIFSEASVALWIYGHRHPKDPRDESCKDIERVFPLGPVDARAYLEKIERTEAKGYTPITASLTQAAKELTPGEGKANAIILVSDGEETCGGDPCTLAEELKRSEASVTIHVVGYAVDDSTRKQLECIARVSGGTYNDAEDPQQLLDALEEAVGATVAQTTLRVEVTDPAGTELHQNIHLCEPGTANRVASYIAWKDNSVPPGVFDLTVDTLPWTFAGNLELPEGSTTVVLVRLGSVKVLKPNGENTQFDLNDASTNSRLGYYEGPLPVAPGGYHVSLKGAASGLVELEPGETKVVQAGILRAIGIDGKHESVNVFTVEGKRLGYYGGEIELLPGSYRIAVNQSTSQPIDVKGGGTVDYQLGAIEVKESCEIREAAGKRLGWYGGTILLVPGGYSVACSGGKAKQELTVKAGEIVRAQ